MPRKSAEEKRVLQAAELRALLDMHMAKRKQLEILVLQEALFEKRLEAIDESAAKKSKVEGPAARAPVSDDEMLVSAADAADAEGDAGMKGGREEAGDGWAYAAYTDYNVRVAGLMERYPSTIEAPVAVAFLMRTVLEALCSGAVSEKEIKEL